MQTENRMFDGLAKLLTNAAGAAQALRGEIETIVKHRIERLAADLDFVPREEFEAVKAMASRARSENEKLAARIGALESKLQQSAFKRARIPVTTPNAKRRKLTQRVKRGKL